MTCGPAGRVARGLSIAALLALAACSRAPQAQPDQFAGKWQSSRLAASPLYMRANGEWEIRNDEDKVLQYGVWHLEEGKMVWTVKIDGRVTHDVNALLSVTPARFELRERDGSVTRFDRIE